MLKIVGVIFLIIVIFLLVFFTKATLTPMVPTDYEEKVNAGGLIEKTYLANGGYGLKYHEYKVNEDFKKYEVWYPAEIEIKNDKYPMIVMLNGTGVKASKYKAQFEHFASWGFIVIGTEEEEAWDGETANKSLKFMINENKNPSSIFYNKIDIENIGVMGHSQGGAGVFNAITELNHSNMYKTAISLSPTNEEMTNALGWHYDLSKINIPIFLVAGTEGDFEMKHVLPEQEMNDMYGKINTFKAMARRLDSDHGDMLYSADGYNTAWFMWHLKNDNEAVKAFTGEKPELLDNKLYTSQKIN